MNGISFFIRQSEETPRSTGFVILFTNIVNREERLLLTENPVVLAKDTDTPKLLGEVVVLHGAAVTPWNSAESVNFLICIVLLNRMSIQ